MKARTTAALAVLAVAALALGGVSVAQQAGGPRSQSANSVQGSSGGGASSVANRGGAAGVPNPDPGGGPAQDGEFGESSGPQGTAARRSGYLGGREAPADGDGGTVVISAPPVGENRPSCHDARPGGLSPTARLSGPNMGRINQVRVLLGAPGQAGRASSSRYLLANLQEELAKPAPDLELAGTYLGIASAAPLTARLVLRASELLCVPLSLEQAASLSASAEGQRLRLEADLR